MASIAVVTVNWRGWPHVLEALASLRTSTHADWRLFIVDNASGDESLDKLADLGPDVTLIANPANSGWAGGCNIGAKAALAEGFDHVFLLNSDAKVRPDTLARLADASAELGDAAVLGCVVRYSESGEVQFCGDERGPDGLPLWRLPEDRMTIDLPPLAPTETVFGAALFAPRAVWAKVGWLDEIYFLNYEETDWCRHAAKLGVPRWIVTDAVVEHVGNASIGGYESPMQIYFMTRNALLYSSRHSRPIQTLGLLRDDLRLFYHWTGIKRRLTGAGLERQPSPRIGALAMAVGHFLIGRFGDAPARVRRVWAAKSPTPS